MTTRKEFPATGAQHTRGVQERFNLDIKVGIDTNGHLSVYVPRQGGAAPTLTVVKVTKEQLLDLAAHID